VWKNIPPPLADVATNYGDLIERIITNLNLLENDFCNAYSANNLRFQYQEGSFHEQYETLKKRDNECYNQLKKQIESICKYTPEALEKTRTQILDQVWSPVDRKLEAMNGKITAAVESKFRKM